MARGIYYFEHAQFTQVSSRVFYDQSLDLRDRGLYAWLVHLVKNSPKFHVTVKTLEGCVPDGNASIRKGMRHLELAGYLVRAQKRRANGTLGEIEYILFDSPVDLDEAEERAIECGLVCIIDPQTGTKRAVKGSPMYNSDATPAHEVKRTEHKHNPRKYNGNAHHNFDPHEVSEAYAALVNASVKTVSKYRAAETARAYKGRIAEGYSEAEIAAAYRIYIKGYKARHGDNIQYVKQLPDWLTCERFEQDVKAARSNISERQEMNDNSILRNVPEEEQKKILEREDPTYALWVKNAQEQRDKYQQALHDGDNAAAKRAEREWEKYDQFAYRRFLKSKHLIAEIVAAKKGVSMDDATCTNRAGPSE